MYKELAGERGGGSGYLFPFLSGTKNGHEEYLEYTAALSRFNRNLKTLKEVAGIVSDVTSYMLRHYPNSFPLKTNDLQRIVS